MNPLKQLQEQGQAVWLDYIKRDLITSGELGRLIDEDGVQGMTSNPTIFEKAIAGGNEYDEQIKDTLAKHPNIEVKHLYEIVAIKDIRLAADALRPVFDSTTGRDGYVSLEVSPHIAHDVDATTGEAKRLFKEVDRPNILIKVPATKAGTLAFQELIASGVNVNVTLMFSLVHYEAIAQAYIRGLKRCRHPEKIASVASFFVSRVDSIVDKALDANGSPEALALKGKIAVANAKVAYARFEELFYGEPFEHLKKKGARVQRCLWASTSTKNPEYSDTLYVDELIGADTVNTLPPATLDDFRDHGTVAATLGQGIDEARAQIAKLGELGIDFDALTEQLQDEGVKSFAKSYDDLLHALEDKGGHFNVA